MNKDPERNSCSAEEDEAEDLAQEAEEGALEQFSVNEDTGLGEGVGSVDYDQSQPEATPQPFRPIDVEYEAKISELLQSDTDDTSSDTKEGVKVKGDINLATLQNNFAAQSSISNGQVSYAPTQGNDSGGNNDEPSEGVEDEEELPQYSHLRPDYSIPVIISMVIILHEIKDYHDQCQSHGETAPPVDKPLNQFLITTPFRMAELKVMLSNVFMYYTDEENLREFFKDLQAKQGGLSHYLDSDCDGKENLYFIKQSVCGDLFQELMLMALNEEHIIPLLLNPEYLLILSKSRLPFSDSLLLAMVLLSQGEEVNGFAVNVHKLLACLDQLQPRTLGCSQQDWEDERIKVANAELIGKLIDHDMFMLLGADVTFKNSVDLNQVWSKIVDAYKRVSLLGDVYQLPAVVLGMLRFFVGQEL